MVRHKVTLVDRVEELHEFHNVGLVGDPLLVEELKHDEVEVLEDAADLSY